MNPEDMATNPEGRNTFPEGIAMDTEDIATNPEGSYTPRNQLAMLRNHPAKSREDDNTFAEDIAMNPETVTCSRISLQYPRIALQSFRIVSISPGITNSGTLNGITTNREVAAEPPDSHSCAPTILTNHRVCNR